MRENYRIIIFLDIVARLLLMMCFLHECSGRGVSHIYWGPLKKTDEERIGP